MALNFFNASHFTWSSVFIMHVNLNRLAANKLTAPGSGIGGLVHWGVTRAGTNPTKGGLKNLEVSIHLADGASNPGKDNGLME